MHPLSLLSLFLPLTSAFTFAGPTPGTTINLASQDVRVTWTYDTTDPQVFWLLFTTDYMFQVIGFCNTSAGSYAWNASDTAYEWAFFNETIFLGDPVWYFEAQQNSTKQLPLLATSGDFNITGYPGLTSTENAAVRMGVKWCGFLEAVLGVVVGALLI